MVQKNEIGRRYWTLKQGDGVKVFKREKLYKVIKGEGIKVKNGKGIKSEIGSRYKVNKGEDI